MGDRITASFYTRSMFVAESFRQNDLLRIAASDNGIENGVLPSHRFI